MDLDFLNPLPPRIPAQAEILSAQALGKRVRMHTVQGGLPSLEGVRIALIGVNEIRNEAGLPGYASDLERIRREFYQLFPGNWGITLADLGDLLPGATPADTAFVLSRVCNYLIRKSIIPVVLGGTQDLTYAMYRAFDDLDRMVNLVGVDARFDLSDGTELVSSTTYMSRIIMNEPHNLFNFTNLGYQTFFNAQEEIDLIDKLFFDAYRLGEVTHSLSVAEPAMRDADLVSVDMTSVKAADMGGGLHAYPNGFDGMQICALARYAGISDKLSAFGIFETGDGQQASRLVAQMLWYFAEGVSLRQHDHPKMASSAFTYYTIPLDEMELHFLKSNRTGRWWVEIPQIENSDNKFRKQTLLPCTREEYEAACEGLVPERCWKAYRKMMV